MVNKPAAPAEDDPFDSDDDEGPDLSDEPTAKPAATPEPPESSTEKPKQGSRKSRKPPDDNVGKVSPNTPAARPSISLDVRNLTKKQREQLSSWRGEEVAKKVDAFFGAQIAKARQQFGQNAVFAGGKDLDGLLIGIPTPALPFEYVVSQDCFPLGLIVHLNGPPGSLKSSLFFEFARWFKMANGGSVLNEVESKLSPDLPRSIIGEDVANTLVINRCDSVEDWQVKLGYWINKLQKDMEGTKEDPGPGPTIPVLFGVDTIMGKASYETQEKIDEQGYAGRGFPVEALSITSWLRSMPQKLDGWPFALVLSNHMKMGKDDNGNDVRRTAGGAGVKFQESFELETRVRKSRIKSKDWDGIVISFKCHKNSFGPTFREAYTRMLWWEETGQDGVRRQRTVWDWDWGTIKLLSGLEGREKTNVKSVLHLDTPKTSDVDNLAWSKTLGMTSSDALPWTDVGYMIRKDAKLMDQLRAALEIKSRPRLAGNYVEQIEQLKKKLE